MALQGMVLVVDGSLWLSIVPCSRFAWDLPMSGLMSSAGMLWLVIKMHKLYGIRWSKLGDLHELTKMSSSVIGIDRTSQDEHP